MFKKILTWLGLTILFYWIASSIEDADEHKKS